LTTKCPRCKQAFIDLEGCFALTCGNIQCRCGFCAWCFQDCGSDAHRHVPNCSWGVVDGQRLGVFGDVSLLNQVWNRIRRQKINEELKNCDGKIRSKILDSLSKEFKNVQLVM
jgi:hypothetical protein